MVALQNQNAPTGKLFRERVVRQLFSHNCLVCPICKFSIGPIFQDGGGSFNYLLWHVSITSEKQVCQLSMSPQRPIDPISLLAPRRKITGISAILLPLLADDSVDWDGFDAHVQRTLDAGLIPAVNMDTGYGHLIDQQTRAEVLQRTSALCGDRGFVAGAFVKDTPDATLDLDAYRRGIEQIESFAGTPIFFQSYGLINGRTMRRSSMPTSNWPQAVIRFMLSSWERSLPRLVKIYSLEVYEQLMLNSGLHRCQTLVAFSRARVATAGASQSRAS